MRQYFAVDPYAKGKKEKYIMQGEKWERALELEIEERILGIANLYNELSTSDLQGIVSVEAKKIIDFVRANSDKR